MIDKPATVEDLPAGEIRVELTSQEVEALTPGRRLVEARPDDGAHTGQDRRCSQPRLGTWWVLSTARRCLNQHVRRHYWP